MLNAHNEPSILGQNCSCLLNSFPCRAKLQNTIIIRLWRNIITPFSIITLEYYPIKTICGLISPPRVWASGQSTSVWCWPSCSWVTGRTWTLIGWDWRGIPAPPSSASLDGGSRPFPDMWPDRSHQTASLRSINTTLEPKQWAEQLIYNREYSKDIQLFPSIKVQYLEMCLS